MIDIMSRIKFLRDSQVYQVFLLSIIGYVLNYVFNLYVSSHISAAMFGDFSMVVTMFNYVVPLIALGASDIIVVYVPEYFRKNDWFRIKYCILWAIKRAFQGTVLFLGIGYLLWVFLGNDHLLSSETVLMHHICYLVIWLAPLVVISNTMNNFLIAIKQLMFSAVFVQLIRPLIKLAVFISAVVVFKTISHIAILYFFAISYVLIGCSFLGAAYIKFNWSQISKCPDASIKQDQLILLRQEWTRRSPSLMLTVLVYSTLPAIGLLSLEIFHSNEAVVGAYAVILLISSLISMLGDAANTLLKPLISIGSFSCEQKLGFQKQLKTNTIALIASGLFIVGFIAVWGSDLLSHFNPLYESFYRELLLLLLATVVSTLVSPAAFILNYSGETRSVLIGTAFQSV